jgi:MFS family permease
LLVITQGRHVAEAGVLVGVLPFVLSLVAPLAGSLTDRMGSRLICAASLLAMAAAFVVIVMGGSHVGAGRLIWALALAGAGLGGFEAPNDVDVLRSLPRDRLGAGTATVGAVRNLGMTFGVAAGATVLDYAMAHGTGTQAERTALGAKWALSTAAASAVLGALGALLRPGGPPRLGEVALSGSANEDGGRYDRFPASDSRPDRAARAPSARARGAFAALGHRRVRGSQAHRARPPR